MKVSRRSNRVEVVQKRSVLKSPEEKNARGWSANEKGWSAKENAGLKINQSKSRVTGCCKLRCFLQHNRGWSVKALVVSPSIPFIGQQRSPEARNIPSIEYEQTKARKGSSPACKNLSINIARFEASTSKRCMGVSDKERSAAVCTFMCWKGLCEKQSPGCVHSVHRRAARM